MYEGKVGQGQYKIKIASPFVGPKVNKKKR
ncbi:hypothetical protein E2C01_000686 [Portunus trituberculatus]|uniref:Uncharacterized protein n=1 Tax=Portunus trituberculatus TaxID=210409 RepID=A0A5B7CH82_PORTR|nr:hypothetical protein [Portunus trituberculatus]